MTSKHRVAWADAASIMLADVEGHSEALTAVVGPMIERGDVAELARTLTAALQLGTTMLEKECAAGEGEPGPVLRYVVSVQRSVRDTG